VDLIRVTDDTTKAEIAETLTHLAQYAMRQQHHRDCIKWLKAHEKMDALLEDWEKAPA
jgi:hypothetical protein